ncbi:MAG: DUF971 domain-containing protein [Alphaproteobacteria bacterium]|nr:DUF971 domain-containing protein [Alphaproteobacteria bacterium]
MATDDWPAELRLSADRRVLTLVDGQGRTGELPAEYLRVESPSAEVQGHGPDQRVLVGGKARVAIARLEPVGNYAIRIVFDDGHDTGLYTFSSLAELAREREERWRRYLTALAAQGLSRG